MNVNVKLDDRAVRAIEAILSKGDRVELIPVKDGIKVVRIHREVAVSSVSPP